MFIFIVISSVLIVLVHKFVMKAVNSYEYYGSNSIRQEWINFEREHLRF